MFLCLHGQDALNSGKLMEDILSSLKILGCFKEFMSFFRASQTLRKLSWEAIRIWERHRWQVTASVATSNRDNFQAVYKTESSLLWRKKWSSKSSAEQTSHRNGKKDSTTSQSWQNQHLVTSTYCLLFSLTIPSWTYNAEDHDKETCWMPVGAGHWERRSAPNL